MKDKIIKLFREIPDTELARAVEIVLDEYIPVISHNTIRMYADRCQQIIGGEYVNYTSIVCSHILDEAARRWANLFTVKKKAPIYEVILNWGNDSGLMVYKESVFKLAGLELSTMSDMSPFFVHGEIVRLPNRIVRKLNI